MVTIPHITQNMFYIILAAIAVVGLIVLILQFRSVRNSTKRVNALSKETELKKLQLVEIDMKSSQIMNGKGLSKNDNGRLNLKKINRSNLMSKIGHFNNEIDYRVDNLESSKEYLKIQNCVKDLDRRTDEFGKKGKNVWLLWKKLLEIGDKMSEVGEKKTGMGDRVRSTVSGASEKISGASVSGRVSGVSEKLKGSVNVSTNTDTLSNKIDLFLDEKSDQLIKDWELATQDDILDIEKRYTQVSNDMGQLENNFNEFRGSTNKKLKKIEERLDKLEKIE